MRMYASLLPVIVMAMVPATTAAFSQTPFLSTFPEPRTRRTWSCLEANSDNIRAAMEASQWYGPTSPEARLAWETVEDLDGRDNSAAFATGSVPWTEEQFVDAHQQILDALVQVQSRTEDLISRQHWRRTVTAQLRAIPLIPPTTTPAPPIAGLEEAKLRAGAMSRHHGPQSTEARLAWEEVEEIAAAGLQNAMGQDLTQLCVLAAAEACSALEELESFLYQSYYGQEAHYYPSEGYQEEGYQPPEGEGYQQY